LMFFAYQGLKSSSMKGLFNREVETVVKNEELSLLSRDYDQQVNYAKLSISGGAVEYTLMGKTDKLIDIEAHGSMSKFSLSSKILGDRAELEFTQKSSGEITTKGFSAKHRATIQLNTDPVWDLKLEIG